MIYVLKCQLDRVNHIFLILKNKIRKCYIRNYLFVMAKRTNQFLTNLSHMYDFEVEFEPFLIRPHVPPEGAPKEAMFGTDQPWAQRLMEVGEQIGTHFTMKFDRMPHTPVAHALLEYTRKQHGWQKQNDLKEAMFKSLFDEGVCPDTPETLTKIGAKIGLAAEAVKTVISNDDNVKNVRKRAVEWATVGVSGVPHVFMNGYNAFSGALDPEDICKYFDAVVKKERIDLPV